MVSCVLFGVLGVSVSILGAFLAYLVVWNSIHWVLFGVFGILVGVLGFWLCTLIIGFRFMYLVSVWRTWYIGWRTWCLYLGILFDLLYLECELVHLKFSSLKVYRFVFICSE